MAKINSAFLAFNRGRISTKALARVDLDRTALSSEIQTNLIPRVLGSASVRPGLEHTGARHSVGASDTGHSISIPFTFAQNDQAEIEITMRVLAGVGSSAVRFWVDDALLADGTGGTPASTITNPTFAANLTGWTDADESGAASTHAFAGYMALLGTGTNSAIRYQNINSGDDGIKHTLAISIQRGPVVLKIGSSIGGKDHFSATLKTGDHSISFTPASANLYIQFSSALDYTVNVDSCDISTDSVKVLAGQWATADLYKIRWTQSADIVYVACKGYKTKAIERRSNGSWSIVDYDPEDGPFGVINTSEITMTPSAISGDITLTTNKAYWATGTSQVGELYKLLSAGQNVAAAVTAQNTFTSSILVTGSSRTFSVSISNTFVATVTLQRSEDDATWGDVETYTTGTAAVFDDELDELQYYYRIGVKTGDFTSGTADLLLSFNGGSRLGIAKITSITSTTVAAAVVLSHFGSITATLDWYRSVWSDAQGYPSSIDFFENRLYLAGKGRILGSVTDGYESFDNDVIGDSGPINRILGSTAIDDIFWLVALDRLLIGSPFKELTCKSNAFDEPLTATNFNVKTADSQGAAEVNIVEDGQVGVFVQRSGSSVYQLQYDGSNYSAADLAALIPEIGEPRIVRLAIQKQPDTRIHCVRSDGTVGLLVKDEAEKTLAWVDIETDGTVTDAYVFPAQEGELEDRVYYTVKRNDVHYREKWALESEAEGGSGTKMVDSFETFSSPGSATLTLTHFSNGDTVYAWVDGILEGPFTVATLQITVSLSPTIAYVGLPYSWQWKSVKLAYGANMGTALLQRKYVSQMGLIAQNIHPSAFQYGPNFTDLSDLPLIEGGEVIDTDDVRSTYDEETFPFEGVWNTDSRICLQGSLPKPCTLLGLVFTIQTNDKD